MNVEVQYLNILEQLLESPVRGDRTGTGTRSMFGVQMRLDISKKFPLLTTKKVNLKTIFHELKWMLMGQTNIKYLVDNGVNIWNDWPYKHYCSVHPEGDRRFLTQEQFVQAIKTNDTFSAGEFSAPFAEMWGDCGPVYGYQWRKWRGDVDVTVFSPVHDHLYKEHDQIADVLKQLRETPESRRMIVNAWNVADVPKMIPSGLPPCHMMMQFYTRPIPLSKKLESIYAIPDVPPTRYLDCLVYIRSNDWFLGAPFNIAQYTMLTHLMANCVNMLPGELIYTVGDAHLYLNHVEQAGEQLGRHPNPLPNLSIGRHLNDPAEVEWEDIQLEDYLPHDAIKAPIAV
jgi:thymidylate synthase